MKKLMTMLLLSGSLYAQDKYLDLKLIGPKTIEVTNKNFNQMGVEYKAIGMTSMSPNLYDSTYGVLTLPMGKTVITYTGNPSKIEMKALLIGVWLGEMPTWVTIDSTVLTQQVSFKSLNVSKLDSATMKVSFQVEGQINVKQYNIQLSADGKEWITRSIVFPDNIKPNVQYTVNVKL